MGVRPAPALSRVQGHWSLLRDKVERCLDSWRIEGRHVESGAFGDGAIRTIHENNHTGVHYVTPGRQCAGHLRRHVRLFVALSA